MRRVFGRIWRVFGRIRDEPENIYGVFGRTCGKPESIPGGFYSIQGVPERPVLAAKQRVPWSGGKNSGKRGNRRYAAGGKKKTWPDYTESWTSNSHVDRKSVV
jgi:hypothetical protein